METRSLLQTVSLPPVKALTSYLLNDLDNLEQPFILVLDDYHRVDEALNALEKAIDLARPGGWIRPFIEPGFPMSDMLNGLKERGAAVDYIEKIL